MSYMEVKKNILAKQMEPLYLLIGTESYLIDDLVQTIVNQVLTEEEQEVNLSTYEMKETPIDIAIEDAETLPFFGDKRIVIVKELYFLTSQRDDKKVEHNLTMLEAYVNNPVPETILIMIAPYEKLDERKKITKLVKKKALVVDAQPFTEKMMLDWLNEQAQFHQVNITNSGKEKLLQLLGVNLMMASKEMEKMSLYVGTGGTIDEDVVTKLVARTLEQDIFALIDHVVHHRLDKGLHILYDLLRKKEEPTKIIALLARQVRIIFQVKELTKRGYQQKQIAAHLKLHPYAVKLAAIQAKKFSNQQLLRWLEHLAEADFNIKSGQMEKKLVVELLLIHFHET